MPEPTVDELFGCDICGKPKAEHRRASSKGWIENPTLLCPTGSSIHQKYREPLRWTDDGHELVGEFVYGQLRPHVACPHADHWQQVDDAEEKGLAVRDTPGCLLRTCSMCEGSAAGCDVCQGTGLEPGRHPCTLQEFCELDDTEFLELAEQWITKLTLPVPMLWHADPDIVEWRPKVATRG